jgi:hypothetical protein
VADVPSIGFAIGLVVYAFGKSSGMLPELCDELFSEVLEKFYGKALPALTRLG